MSTFDFEIEQDQTDGTLADTLERVNSWQYANQGLMIKTLPGEIEFVHQFRFNWVLSEDRKLCRTSKLI